MPKISPFLWFDSQAEEAAKLYVSLFPNSKLGKIARYPEGSPGTPGTVMTVQFFLDGQEFNGLNGGPHFKFNEAVSFAVDCKDQAEVDHYWDKLIAGGGEPSQCGWLKDRFGLSWQIVPTILPQMLTDADPARAKRVTETMMKMSKIVIADLKKAYEGA